LAQLRADTPTALGRALDYTAHLAASATQGAGTRTGTGEAEVLAGVLHALAPGGDLGRGLPASQATIAWAGRCATERLSYAPDEATPRGVARKVEMLQGMAALAASVVDDQIAEEWGPSALDEVEATARRILTWVTGITFSSP
jgi:hypothetical protein